MKSRKFLIVPDGFLWDETDGQWTSVVDLSMKANKMHRFRNKNTVNQINKEWETLKTLGCKSAMIHYKLKEDGIVIKRSSWTVGDE